MGGGVGWGELMNGHGVRGLGSVTNGRESNHGDFASNNQHSKSTGCYWRVQVRLVKTLKVFFIFISIIDVIRH